MKTLATAVAAAMAIVASVAMAQPAPDGAAQSHASVATSGVGHWLYDQQGHNIGSIRSVTDGGQTAVAELGGYFQPGSHEARIPAADLSMVGSKLTLTPGSLALAHR